MSSGIDPENVLSLADSMAAPARAVPAVDYEVDRLKALDAAAWQDLFERHFKKMYAFAYARTGDPQAAEDIASEVFAAAAKGINGRYALYPATQHNRQARNCFDGLA